MRKEGHLGENPVKFKIELLVRGGGVFKERPNPWALGVSTDTLRRKQREEYLKKEETTTCTHHF